MDDEMLETLTPEEMLGEMLQQLLDLSNELLTLNQKFHKMVTLNEKLHAINRKVFNYLQMREQEATRVETETRLQ